MKKKFLSKIIAGMLSLALVTGTFSSVSLQTRAEEIANVEENNQTVSDETSESENVAEETIQNTSDVSEEIITVSAPTNLRWDGYVAMWDYVESGRSFQVVLNYKDKDNNWTANEYNMIDVGAYGSTETGNFFLKDFVQLINSLTTDENVLASEFYFKVCVIDSSSKPISDYVTSETITIKTFSAPTNVKWNDYIAKWDAVEGAEGYQLNLYYKAPDTNGWKLWGIFNTFSSNSYYDYSGFIQSEINIVKENFPDFESIEFYYTVGVADKDNNLVSSIVDSEILTINFDEVSSGSGVTSLQAVTNLRWSDTTPGEAVFYNPNGGNVKVVLQWYKDGIPMSSWSTSTWHPGDVSLPVHFDIEESGSYTYVVEVFDYGVEPDWNFTNGYVSELSPVFNYTRPSEQVSVPSNIRWDSTGMLRWDKVDHADHYWSDLYVKDSSDNDGYRQISGYGSMDNFHDFADKLGDGFEYYVRVKANSNNINLYANGEWSEYIPFKKGDVADKVNGKLENIVGNVTTDNVQGAVSSIKDQFSSADAKSELQVAMQTNDATRDMLEDLEKKYEDSMDVKTKVNPAEDTGIASDSVKILGASLNATTHGEVTFNMKKPDEDTEKNLITNTRFTKAIVLDLGLEGAGIEKGQPLAIPVTITMNPPAGIDVNKLTILHYNTDNTSYETLPVRLNSDGTISFTVTHFSNFVFGEKQQSSTGTTGSNGSTYIKYDAAEEASEAFNQATEETIKAEEAIPVTAFFSAQAINALPADVKEIASATTVFNLSAITTTRGFVAAVDKIVKLNPEEKTITFYSSKPFAFNTKSLTALTNANTEFIYMFNHQGHLYKVTIPAGAKVDLAGQIFAGPLYIGAQLGTSVLVK